MVAVGSCRVISGLSVVALVRTAFGTGCVFGTYCRPHPAISQFVLRLVCFCVARAALGTPTWTASEMPRNAGFRRGRMWVGC